MQQGGGQEIKDTSNHTAGGIQNSFAIVVVKDIINWCPFYADDVVVDCS